MPTQCSPTGMAFGRAAGRNLVAAFDGGLVTSEAGALLLGATDQAIRLVDRFASCFRDGRHPAFVTHRVRSLVGQRIFGLALGYEDLVDHDDLRHDPVLGALLGRFKPDEAAPAPLAGKSTLNRLEHGPADAAGGRYHKIGHDVAAIETVIVDLFLDAFRAKPPREIILDLDATDDPLHGHQAARFFHGYYDCYPFCRCYRNPQCWQNPRRSGWPEASSDEVGQVWNGGLVWDGEPGAGVVPERHTKLLAGFHQAQERVPAIPAHVAAGSAADLAPGHLGPDVVL